MFGLYMGANTGDTFGQIKVLTGGGAVWGDLILQSGGGKVGIGDLSPSTTLEVNGTVTAPTYQSTAADPADSGIGRLGNNEEICWELATPGADKCLKVDTSDNFSFAGGALAVASGGTGATTSQGAINALSQLTTNGDVLYHNGTNSTRLARGTDGQCLTSTATSIQWGSCVAVRSVTYIAGADNASTALADADDQNGFWVNDLGRTYRVTRVWVQSDGGTPSINLQRDDGSATNILTSNLSAAIGNGACADSSGSTMTIRGTSITCSNLVSSSERDIAAGDVLNFVLGAAGGTAKRVTVNIQLTAQ